MLMGDLLIKILAYNILPNLKKLVFRTLVDQLKENLIKKILEDHDKAMAQDSFAPHKKSAGGHSLNDYSGNVYVPKISFQENVLSSASNKASSSAPQNTMGN